MAFGSLAKDHQARTDNSFSGIQRAYNREDDFSVRDFVTMRYINSHLPYHTTTETNKDDRIQIKSNQIY